MDDLVISLCCDDDLTFPAAIVAANQVADVLRLSYDRESNATSITVPVNDLDTFMYGLSQFGVSKDAITRVDARNTELPLPLKASLLVMFGDKLHI